jgi:hypothetical protein
MNYKIIFLFLLTSFSITITQPTRACLLEITYTNKPNNHHENNESLESAQTILQALYQQDNSEYLELNKKPLHITCQSISLLLTLLLITKFIKAPKSCWDLFIKACAITITTGVVSRMGAHLFQSILESTMVPMQLIFDACSEKKAPSINFLEFFIDKWPQYKKQTPEKYHAICDKLYSQYVTMGGKLQITQEQAQAILDILLKTSLNENSKNVYS